MPRHVSPENANLPVCHAPSASRYTNPKIKCRCPGCRDEIRIKQAARYKRLGGNPNRKPETRGYRPSASKRAEGLRRDAIKAAGERFKKIEIYERDEWMCWICGGEIDSNLTYPDPFYVSLDHAVPLSQGGEHTRANARTAHLRCNIQRGRKFLTLPVGPLETRLDAA